MIAIAEIANDATGTWKNALANDASSSITKPINKNLPMKLKSFLVTVAMVAKTKNIVPVPPAAMAMSCAPLLKFNAACNTGPSIKPNSSVVASNNTTPNPLLRLADIAINMPNITANMPNIDKLGCCAMKAKLIPIPR